MLLQSILFHLHLTHRALFHIWSLVLFQVLMLIIDGHNITAYFAHGLDTFLVSRTWIRVPNTVVHIEIIWVDFDTFLLTGLHRAFDFSEGPMLLFQVSSQRVHCHWTITNMAFRIYIMGSGFMTVKLRFDNRFVANIALHHFNFFRFVFLVFLVLIDCWFRADLALNASPILEIFLAIKFLSNLNLDFLRLRN